MYAAARSADASALRTLLMQRNLTVALPEAEAAARMAQLEVRVYACAQACVHKTCCLVFAALLLRHSC